MGQFRDSVLEPMLSGIRSDVFPGVPSPFVDLTRYTGYTQQGMYEVIAGRPTTGKKSFVQYKILNICKWALSFEASDRPPVKIMYFNIGGSTDLLLQKWTCGYLKIFFNIVLDIATLKGDVGQKFSLADPDNEYIVEAIREAEIFFDELLDTGMLEIISTKQNPSNIHDHVEKFMLDEAGDMEHNVFQPNQEWLGHFTFYVIDDVQNLSTESYGNMNLDRQGIYAKMHKFNIELKQKYSVNPIVILPVPFSSSRRVLDTLPSYKDLGVFYNNSDLGYVLYNPFNENNKNYLGFDINDWNIGGKVRFRSVTLARNSHGLQNITKGMIFLEECGYFRELPVPGGETNDLQIEEFLEGLAQLP